MVGRTHGQPGAPITFGFKAASWADEVRRHLDRLREGRPRWLVGQLGGAVGVLGFFGADGPGAARRVLRRARPGRPGHLVADRARPDRRVRARAGDGLRHPGPDRQRGLRAAAPRDRRAARADHRDGRRQHHHAAQAQPRAQRAPRHPGPAGPGVTPACCSRAWSAAHERDGRGWKAEWVALPEVCLLTGAALRARAARCCRGPGGRRRRDAAQPRALGDRLASEQVLAALTGAARQAPRPGAAARGAARRRRATSSAGRRRARGRRSAERGCAAWTAAPGGRRRGPDGRRGAWPGPARPAAEEPDEWTWLTRLPTRFALGGAAHAAGARAAGWRARSGAGRCCVKRDDLTGFGGRRQQGPPAGVPAGRRAWPSGADVLVTGGGAGVELRRGRGAGRARRRAATASSSLVGDAAPTRRTRTWPRALAGGADVRVHRRRRPRRASTPLSPSAPPTLARRGPAAATRCPAAGRRPVGAVGYRRAPPTSWPTSSTRRHRRRRSWCATGSGGTLRRPGRRPVAAAGALARRRRVGEPAAGEIAAAGARRWPRGCARAAAARPPPAADVELVDARGPGFGVAVGRGRARRRGSRCAPRGCCSTPSTRRKALAVPLDAGRAAADGPVVLLAHRRAAGRGRRLARPRRTRDDRARRAAGPPTEGPAPELIESGFALENADAPLLHHGLNLADIAHVLDLRAPRRRPGPSRPASCSTLLLEVARDAGRGLPVRPGVRRALQLPRALLRLPPRRRRRAGCTPAGRAGRPPGSRCACTCARQLVELVDDGRRGSPATPGATGRGARRHADARPDLPAAGAAVDVRALPAVVRLPRACATPRACSTRSTGSTRSPGGAGCVNGSRLLDDRGARSPTLLGLRRRHRAHPRRDVAGRRAHRRAGHARPACCRHQSKLAEDLEIWSSSEFDYVDLADGYTRASVLMPQKRNPYSLSIVRGASGHADRAAERASSRWSRARRRAATT